MKKELYADVIVDISVESLDKPYQYRIPEELSDRLKVGSSVMIPFGRGNRQVKGYIINITDVPAIDVNRIKDVVSAPEKNISAPEQLLSLAFIIKQTYGCTTNEAIKTVLPVKKKIRKSSRRTTDLPDIYRYDRHNETDGTAEEAVKLNDEQKEIVSSFVRDYEHGERNAYLIHGVTGSGKTEVYMSVMEEIIKSGRQVIMLIPEIALTYQTASRFYKRFGDRISIINSRMSAGERYDRYVMAKEGKTDIVIGPRSALFFPFPDLGLIIMDEEHETSYESEMTPRYNAREVAMFRAKLAGASLIYGSATPSVETYYRTTDEYTGKFPVKLYEMKARVFHRAMPDVEIVDMRDEFAARNYSIISRRLHVMIEDRLKKREQVILFINRRGYSGFVSCRACGEAVKCPHCDVSLKVHNTDNGDDKKLVCHYCGYEREMIKRCPSCGSGYIGTFGTGTQKIEEYIKKEFPEARVLRMDADTTGGKTGHADILDLFAGHEADILVGTQMIIKGHDFPKVTLVGILAADMALHAADYMASERCFRSIVQAAGRAGRGDVPGNVIVQTYSPDHFAITMAAKQDYRSFYGREMVYRRLMKYPPSSYIMKVMAGSLVKDNAVTIADDIGHNTKLYFKNNEKADIIGPAPHEIEKLNDMYRYVIHIKYADEKELMKLRDIIKQYVETKYQGMQFMLQIDIT